jgi:hypothetical protein
VVTSRRVDLILPGGAPAYGELYRDAGFLELAAARLPGFLAALEARGPLITFVIHRPSRGYGGVGPALAQWLDPTDYRLGDPFFATLESSWGRFALEAFASPENARLAAFYTRMPHPRSAAAPRG